MEIFDFPYHKVSTKYPENSIAVKMGSGYTFTAKPSAPIVREFVLTFPVLFYYTDSNGKIDTAHNPETNLGRLVEFYEAHQLYEPFSYEHPVYGIKEVKFIKPIEVPEGETGGLGAYKNVKVELQEVL